MVPKGPDFMMHTLISKRRCQERMALPIKRIVWWRSGAAAERLVLITLKNSMLPLIHIQPPTFIQVHTTIPDHIYNWTLLYLECDASAPFLIVSNHLSKLCWKLNFYFFHFLYIISTFYIKYFLRVMTFICS